MSKNVDELRQYFEKMLYKFDDDFKNEQWGVKKSPDALRRINESRKSHSYEVNTNGRVRLLSETRSYRGSVVTGTNVTVSAAGDDMRDVTNVFTMGENTKWELDNRSGDSKRHTTTFVGDGGRKFDLDLSNEHDRQVHETLLKVQETFQAMVDSEREKFLKMFPHFANVRTAPQLFDEAPMETTTYKDGDKIITVQTKCVKASQKISSRIVNGVVQKQSTRAIVEYTGPNGKCRMRLADSDGGQKSDDESDEKDALSVAGSELADDAPSIIVGSMPRLEASKNKLDKAWLAAKELVDTEERYVTRLHLMETFRKRCDDEKILNQKDLNKIFSNLESLHKFHSEHLLPSLLERRRDWQSNQRIGDVFLKFGPYLRLYSQYANNYDQLPKNYQSIMASNHKFSAAVAQVEKLPESSNLPMATHLIEPVQRIMRYHLLLETYKRYLPENHQDYNDTVKAFEMCKSVAEHSDEIMKKLADYKDIIAVQDQIGNQMPMLLTPTRRLIKKGQLTKISNRSNEHQTRNIFLFNDLMLVCSENKFGGLGRGGKMRIRNCFNIVDVQVIEGDRLDVEHSFYIRAPMNGVATQIELYAKNALSKQDWLDKIWHASRTNLIVGQRFSIASPIVSPRKTQEKRTSNASTSGEILSCTICNCAQASPQRNSIIKLLNRTDSHTLIHCINCDRLVCKKCASAKKSILADGKTGRLCTDCQKGVTNNNSAPSSPMNGVDVDKPSRRYNPLAQAAKENIIYGGYLDLYPHAALRSKALTNDAFKRYLAVRQDCVLYVYYDENDDEAVAMTPLAGCRTTSDNIHDTKSTTFKLEHANRIYTLNAPTRDDMAKWTAIIDLAANAELTGSDNLVVEN